ncbi:hypothetical protein [Luteolibacter luteus]|uniref:WYL domain-containing protein n=1 Tax=Luteolibacter luteus TaxID=2728835 RepID=A0A858RHG8_9BACT|nr:hypothetical protein [Luteolibacter luteus]QJE95994.1 WYL domain-containing protein [Luteolibacter luteus]
MADLRGAIRHERVIRFTYEGRNYVVEPHELGRNPVTGTYEFTAWVRSGPYGMLPTWKTFHYWKVRGLEVMPDKFLPRRIAPQTLDFAG